ncbi:MAG TPA: UTP--glucose-1-phosphate uridylyltransferase [Chlamydiales bacterium]|nr:UTP--glucose-1-phosphate uridylyltransferase [Chlamydiales bacterium]
MFRTFARLFLPNPFDWMLKRTAKKGGRRILLGWNRGLGDIALGLYAMVQRIRETIPDAEVTFLIRENLQEGFSMLEGVKKIAAPNWKRGEKCNVKRALHLLGIDSGAFDLIVENPSPTDWVRWQRGRVVPKLKWDPKHEDLWKKFAIPPGTCIGVQVAAETNYGLWRNWPLERWKELFDRLEKIAGVKVILFGFGDEPQFSSGIDLRGKTTLFELLSIIKNRCQFLILPDSGILSMVYYLDESFPIHLISLWADPDHGILKQGVPSPNPQLVHTPLIGKGRDLSGVSVDVVMEQIFPRRPLKKCARAEEIEKREIGNVGAIILAGGQGTRLGISYPKGLFRVQGKALFQWICEKVPRKDLPIAVMTSPLNHEETVSFFERHQFFGLDLHFFQQEMSPLLDEKRREVGQGPNGNGSVFRSFVQSGLVKRFAEKGVDLVTVVPVDNPLAHPFDPVLIAFAREKEADIVIKCIERKENSMGVLAERRGKIEVVEYTEVDPQQLGEYRLANTGQLAIRLSFFEKMANVALPIHWVQKRMQIGAQMRSIWKGEQFIFDAFPYAERVEAICASRETCYAPLKNKESLEAVQKALAV